MRNRNIIHWLWLGLLICLLDAAPAHAFYNPQQGRWLSRDPIGESGSISLYVIAENNPVSKIDILGLLYANQLLEIKDGNDKIGEAKVDNYARVPFDGKMSENVHRVGAILQIVPKIYDCECCVFKWRQRFSQMEDDKYSAAPPREGKWQYLDPDITELKDVLDWVYVTKRDSEWYGPPDFPPGQTDGASACAYSFSDQPRQLPAHGLFASPPLFKKLTVSFKLELVKLKSSEADAKSGGKVVLSVDWGFWYTKDENGLLNKTSRSQ